MILIDDYGMEQRIAAERRTAAGFDAVEVAELIAYFDQVQADNDKAIARWEAAGRPHLGNAPGYSDADFHDHQSDLGTF